MGRRTETSGRGRLRGFTLIEIFVALAIVALLAMVAYPGYVTQIQKVRRADSQTVLMQNAQFLERIHTQTGCYGPGPDSICNNADDLDGAVAEDDNNLPYKKSPIDGSSSYYTMSYVLDASADAYTLRADPQGSQAGAGYMTLDNLGRKIWDENDDDSIANSEKDWLSN